MRTPFSDVNKCTTSYFLGYHSIFLHLFHKPCLPMEMLFPASHLCIILDLLSTQYAVLGQHNFNYPTKLWNLIVDLVVHCKHEPEALRCCCSYSLCFK